MTKVKKKRRRHRVWQLQEAKAQFSELINEVEKDGYHTITRNGHVVAMVVSKSEFEKMEMSENTLLDFFRGAPLSEFDLDLERDKDTVRDVEL